MDELDICYLCFRIPFDQILSLARKVWMNEDLAKDAAIWSREQIKKIYRENRTALCGKSYKSILGSLFYIFGNMDQRITLQRQIREALNISTSVTILSGLKTLKIYGLYLDSKALKNLNKHYKPRWLRY